MVNGILCCPGEAGAVGGLTLEACENLLIVSSTFGARARWREEDVEPLGLLTVGCASFPGPRRQRFGSALMAEPVAAGGDTVQPVRDRRSR